MPLSVSNTISINHKPKTTEQLYGMLETATEKNYIYSLNGATE